MSSDDATTPQSLTPVLPVPDLGDAVAFWTTALGVEPTFVDGDRWAQFDVAGRRLALAGADRTSEQAGVMIKVADVEAARDALSATGVVVGSIERGPHEVRCTTATPGGWPLVLYASA